MSYSQALEEQMALLAYEPCQTDESVEVMGSEWKPNSGELSDMVYGASKAILKCAAPYYWAPEICKLIEATSDSIPAYSLRQEDLPTPYGFCWFPEGMTLPGPAQPDDHVTRMPFVIWANRFDGGGLHIILGQSVNYRPSGLPGTIAVWDFGQTIDDVIEGIPKMKENGPDGITPEMMTARTIKQLRIVAAALAFMNQRILKTTPERPARTTRKRAARIWESEPIIRVVHLRRVAQSGQPSDGRDVEWSCQWVVSGHWREQFYPSTKEHRPLWILPYIKGPEDKPLKVSAQRVFAVER